MLHKNCSTDCNKTYYKSDRLGVIVSLLCAVHCAALPLLLSFGVLEMGFMSDHVIVDAIFLALSFYIAGNSLVASYRKIHRNFKPLVLAGLGFSIFIPYLFIFHDHSLWYLSVIAGLLIAGAHMYNHRLVHQFASH